MPYQQLHTPFTDTPSRRKRSRRQFEQRFRRTANRGVPQYKNDNSPRLASQVHTQRQTREGLMLENYLIMLQDCFFQLDQRAQHWGRERASHFLAWWLGEVQRVGAEVVERGFVELQREDGANVLEVGN